MPNNTGPHSANNAKTSGLPANLKKEMIIGYTREAKDPTRPVTVYTSLGHFTQVHPSSWNIGWTVTRTGSAYSLETSPTEVTRITRVILKSRQRVWRPANMLTNSQKTSLVTPGLMG